MRIVGPNAASAAASAPRTRRAGAGTFAVSDTDAPRMASANLSIRTLGGIDALIALQGVEDPAERRRRAVKRGRSALDALDDLKLGVLSGQLDSSALSRLRALAGDLDGGTGDARLDHVLAEIGLRVAVEIAKFENRAG